MLVKDIMTTEIERISQGETLAAAVERMLRNEVDHVIVRDGETPTALVTYRTALLAAFRADEPLSDIPLTRFGRGFERTSSPDRAVLLSVGQLRRAETGCLPVLQDMTVVGVLTQEDVVANVANMTSQTLEADREAREWSGTRGEAK